MRASPELRRALPAGLDGVAEAGVIYVILQDVAIHEGRASGGPMATYPAFLAVFTVAVVLATAYRRSLAAKVLIPAAAVVVGLLQATVWGRGGLSAVATVVVLALLVALRVATLAVRDWREPIGTSFAFWTVVLLGEVTVVASADRVGGLLPVVAVVFFAGSLGSRAASVWLENRPDRRQAEGPRALPQRSAVVLLVALGATLAIGLALGIPGGPVDVSGAFLYRWVAESLAFVAGLIAAVLLPVLSWLFGLVDIHVDAQPVREAIQKIKPATHTGGGALPIERILGVILFVLLLFLLLRAIRRQWQMLQPEEPSRPEPEPDPRLHALARPRRRRTPRIRRELPVDTVRRWYAEALLSLERLGLPKPASRTPGEYLPEVTRRFPESARGFTALTRAYEQVRYGALVLDREAVWRLEVERDAAMQALGKARRLNDPDTS